MSWRIKTQPKKKKKKKTGPMPDGNLGRIMTSAAWKCGQMVRTVVLPSDRGGKPVRRSAVTGDQRQLGKTL